MPKNKPTTKTTSNVEAKPEVAGDEVLVILSKDEALSLTQILLFSKNVFGEMAVSLMKEGKEQDAELFNARSLLSQLILSKFKEQISIGEPESRQVH